MNALHKYTVEQLRAEITRRERPSKAKAPKLPGFRADAWCLPDDKMLGFVEVPGGKFTMGSDKTKDTEAYDECPQRSVDVPRFFVARTPVTVAQFRAYVEDGGKVDEPRVLKGEADHPVVLVSQIEATAYCEWLTARLRKWSRTPRVLKDLLCAKRKPWSVRLPTEEQWEKASRGTDGRIYPWGNDFDPKKLNCYESGAGRTTPVGTYPAGASPYGLLDTVGNVWEWTSSLWRKGESYQVIKGGSFYNYRRHTRCAYRSLDHPENRYDSIGFRAALSPFPSDL